MARELAETMVKLGDAHGVRTTALLTDMDTPLGRTAGNALEVTESVEVLQGGGPTDLIEVTLALATEMLALAGIDADPAAALTDGRAHDVYRSMIAAQGGDPDAQLPVASTRHTVDAASSGYLQRLDALAVGVAAWRLGAGRSRKEDPVSPSAGVVCLAKPGEQVTAGEPVLELHIDDPTRLEGALEALEGAITIGAEPPAPSPHVIDRVHVSVSQASIPARATCMRSGGIPLRSSDVRAIAAIVSSSKRKASRTRCTRRRAPSRTSADRRR